MSRNKVIPIVVVTLGGLLAVNAFGQAAGTIVTVAGTGTQGYDGDNKPAINAALNVPPHVALDQAGNIYIADQYNHRIRKVDVTGKITTFAGTGVAGYNGDSQPATSAQINTPTGVFADLYGNVYICEPGNYRIRKVDTNGMISTVAGDGQSGYNGDNINATNASLYAAVRAVVDPAGNIYIADQSNQRVRKVSPSGIITTIAGTGVGNAATRLGSYNGDGPALSTDLNNPTAVALDAAGNVYFADQYNHRIREITEGQVITIAGTGTAGYNGDGAPLNTNLNYPGGVILDPAGAIYFADDNNQSVRKISADRSRITTIAGTGTAGYNGDSLPAINAQLNNTFGIGLDSSGNVYLADSGNNRIRKIFSAASAVGAPPVVTGVGNAASFVSGLTPGGLVTVFGKGIANGATGSITAPSFPLPTELAGVVVTMGGLAAPIYSVYNVGGQQQVSAQVPYELAGQSSVPVTVTAQGAYSAPVTISLLPVQPGIFVYGGTNAVATHNADGSLVTASNPAVPGEVVIIYMTGLGAVNPPVPTGFPAPLSPLSQTPTNPTVTLGGGSASVIFSGLAPTFAGLYQIDITVPSNAPAGNQNLIVTLDGVQSNTATLAVK